MDICDEADVITQQTLDDGLSRIGMTASVGNQLIIDGVVCCVDCEEPIPLARLKAVPGCCRCAECQAEIE